MSTITPEYFIARFQVTPNKFIWQNDSGKELPVDNFPLRCGTWAITPPPTYIGNQTQLINTPYVVYSSLPSPVPTISEWESSQEEAVIIGGPVVYFDKPISISSSGSVMNPVDLPSYIDFKINDLGLCEGEKILTFGARRPGPPENSYAILGWPFIAISWPLDPGGVTRDNRNISYPCPDNVDSTFKLFAVAGNVMQEVTIYSFEGDLPNAPKFDDFR